MKSAVEDSVGAGAARCVVVALAVVACDAVVFGTGWLEMDTVNLVYPTSGLALGLLWLWGWRCWPGVLAGSALTSWYFFGGFTDATAAAATGWTLVALVVGTAGPDALTAGLGAWLLRGRETPEGRAEPLSTLSGALRLMVVGALLLPAASTLLSGALVWGLTGRPGDWWVFAEVWWVSLLLGNLIVAPGLAVWGRWSSWAMLRSASGGAMCWVVLGFVAVCVASFTPWSLPVPVVFPWAVGMPLLVWAAIGWEARGATLGLMLASSFAVVGTVHGYGVFATLMPLEKLDYLQWGLAALSVTLLPLGAVTAEQRAQARAIRAQHDDLALQRDRLRKLSRRVQETEYRERRELATRLHDGMNQYLAVARLAVEGEADGEATADVTRAAEALRKAEAEGRAVINDLSPPALSALGLHAALSALVRRFESEFDLPVLYDGRPAQVRPAPAVEAFLLRCARELLFNVVKHAGASRAGIEYRADGSRVELVVWDDGPGFDVAARLNGTPAGDAGFGLFSIHEQAAAMGGSLAANAGERKGVMIRLPGYNGLDAGDWLASSPAGPL